MNEEKRILTQLCAKINSCMRVKYRLHVKESEWSNKIFTIYLKDLDPYGNEIELVSNEFKECKLFLLKWNSTLIY